MKRARPKRNSDEEMLPEYDFSGGVRGKYAGRFAADTIMVTLDPDVSVAVRERAKRSGAGVGSLVNDWLRKDIRQARKLNPSKRTVRTAK